MTTTPLKIAEIKRIIYGESTKIVGKIAYIGKPRTVSNGENTVVNAIFRDDSDEMDITFWNSHISQVKEGEKYEITNVKVTTFDGKPQLNLTRSSMVIHVEQ